MDDYAETKRAPTLEPMWYHTSFNTRIVQEKKVTCEVYCLHSAVPTDLSLAGTTCGLGLDVLGIDILSMAARYRTAVKSGTLNNGLEKIGAARECDGAPIFALLLNGTRYF